MVFNNVVVVVSTMKMVSILLFCCFTMVLITYLSLYQQWTWFQCRLLLMFHSFFNTVFIVVSTIKVLFQYRIFCCLTMVSITYLNQQCVFIICRITDAQRKSIMTLNQWMVLRKQMLKSTNRFPNKLEIARLEQISLHNQSILTSPRTKLFEIEEEFYQSKKLVTLILLSLYDNP